jgi:hypothetical protein
MARLRTSPVEDGEPPSGHCTQFRRRLAGSTYRGRAQPFSFRHREEFVRRRRSKKIAPFLPFSPSPRGLRGEHGRQAPSSQGRKALHQSERERDGEPRASPSIPPRRRDGSRGRAGVRARAPSAIPLTPSLCERGQWLSAPCPGPPRRWGSGGCWRGEDDRGGRTSASGWRCVTEALGCSVGVLTASKPSP